MARSIDYESTKAPASLQTLGTGPNAANLGKRPSTDTALIEAFDEPSRVDGAPRNTEGGQLALLDIAKTKMAEYAGENPMFPQYRRSFEPGGTVGLTEEYVAVRDKNTVVTGVGTGLGTPYSPTIASPGAQNGINPSNLASIASNVNGLVAIGDKGQYVPSSPDTLALDNPSGAVHQNVDSLGRVDGVAPDAKVTGTVRRFTLGVGSGGASTTTEVAARGQFPRPLT